MWTEHVRSTKQVSLWRVGVNNERLSGKRPSRAPCDSICRVDAVAWDQERSEMVWSCGRRRCGARCCSIHHTLPLWSLWAFKRCLLGRGRVSAALTRHLLTSLSGQVSRCTGASEVMLRRFMCASVVPPWQYLPGESVLVYRAYATLLKNTDRDVVYRSHCAQPQECP
jgi:hypothetical protein